MCARGTPSLSKQKVAKATTRLAEASWVSFEPSVTNYETGWMISSLDTVVDPTDVVAHGAVHLHAMGANGAMVYKGPEGTMSIASLDAPVVSCGVLSPFPTPGDNSTLKDNMAKGMHWNTQNNIWYVVERRAFSFFKRICSRLAYATCTPIFYS